MITNEEQCTYVCRGKTPWIPWSGNTFNATGENLQQGPSSIKILGNNTNDLLYWGNTLEPLPEIVMDWSIPSQEHL